MFMPMDDFTGKSPVPEVIANRMWKKFSDAAWLNRSMTGEMIPKPPFELLDHLEKLMVRVKFDLKEFQRVLLNVKAFDREAVNYELANDQPYASKGPVLARPPSSCGDSFVSLAIPYPDERTRDPLNH